MSQYPPPYQHQPTQPGGYYPTGGYTDPLAPAKRSSIIMFILGGILSLCGLCFMGLGPLMNNAAMAPEQQAEFNRIEEQAGLPVSTILVGMGVASIVPGLVLVILGFFIRGGGMGAAITSIVFVCLFSLGTLLLLIGSVISLIAGDLNALLGGAALAIVLALLGLLLFQLLAAARNASQVSAMQAQYQMQYWQYQQHQRAYQQQPPMPPPPATPKDPQQNWPPPPTT
jgi:hypothetical protein